MTNSLGNLVLILEILVYLASGVPYNFLVIFHTSFLETSLVKFPVQYLWKNFMQKHQLRVPRRKPLTENLVQKPRNKYNSHVGTTLYV